MLKKWFGLPRELNDLRSSVGTLADQMIKLNDEKIKLETRINKLSTIYARFRPDQEALNTITFGIDPPKSPKEGDVWQTITKGVPYIYQFHDGIWKDIRRDSSPNETK